MVTRAAIPRETAVNWELSKQGTAIFSVSEVKISYMRTAIFTLKNNMADAIEEKENYNFPVREVSLDSDPEVVIRREALDTLSTPGDEINGKLAQDFDHGFKNWTNTFDVDRESHIETVEENASIDGNERFVRQENTGTADYEKITQYETRTKPLEKDIVKSPEVEFRHRYLQQQQLQQQQEQQERLSSQNEDTRMSQSNNQSSKSMEEKLKINKKQEVPSISETASEDKLHDGFTSKFLKGVMGAQGNRITSHCSGK